MPSPIGVTFAALLRTSLASCAVVLACFLPQARLQTALWRLVSAAKVTRLPVPQGIAERNQSIAWSLMARHIPFEDVSDSLEQKIAKFLLYLNGDWSLGNVMHHCSPETCACISEDDAKEKIFAVLLEVGALLGSDCNLPSPNRWGTCTKSAGRFALFVLCHNILPRCVGETFASWKKCEIPVNPDAQQESEFRAYNRSKAWRTKCVCSNPSRFEFIVSVAFASIPLDRLLATLQHLDSAGKCLLDCAFTPLSPVSLCQQQLMSLIGDPLGDSPHPQGATILGTHGHLAMSRQVAT